MLVSRSINSSGLVPPCLWVCVTEACLRPFILPAPRFGRTLALRGSAAAGKLPANWCNSQPHPAPDPAHDSLTPGHGVVGVRIGVVPAPQARGSATAGPSSCAALRWRMRALSLSAPTMAPCTVPHCRQVNIRKVLLKFSTLRTQRHGSWAPTTKPRCTMLTLPAVALPALASSLSSTLSAPFCLHAPATRWMVTLMGGRRRPRAILLGPSTCGLCFWQTTRGALLALLQGSSRASWRAARAGIVCPRCISH